MRKEKVLGFSVGDKVINPKLISVEGIPIMPNTKLTVSRVLTNEEKDVIKRRNHLDADYEVKTVTGFKFIVGESEIRKVGGLK